MVATIDAACRSEVLSKHVYAPGDDLRYAPAFDVDPCLHNRREVGTSDSLKTH